jgi:SAM-dependent methyltransferase
MDKEEKLNNATVAATLAKDIRSVAEKARNEEELRIGVEKLLEPALKKLGIAANPRYEKRISRTVLTAVGRADALYGQAIIEYEPPGKLSTAKGKNSTKKQIEGYLLGLAGSGKQREDNLRRIAGIAIDGQSIFFVRYRADKPLPQETIPKEQLTQFPLFEEEGLQGSFVEIGPYQITEESINEFLMYLRALRRRRLSADELGKEFGPEGEVAHQMVNALYTRLEECLTAPGNLFPRVETLYEEWKRIFGIVYGQEIGKAQKDALALARLYHIDQFTDLKPLLFAVHTYYAFFMKLLAAELLSLQQGALLPSIAEQLPAAPSEVLQSSLHNLENNTWFEAQGIRNFLEADFFGWYLSSWNAEIEGAVRNLARCLAEYEPATGTLAPEDTRDLLKKLYQYLLPRELRHDLGEYYTPDWLAEVVLNDVGYTGKPEMRVLDPACGSGTFLVLAIRRIRDYAQDSMTSRAKGEHELLSHILENVVGFDLNPLAVISARTNYLLALGNLARHMSGKDIPVYICDSVLTPQSQRTQKRPLAHQKDIPVPSAQKEFWIPEEIVDKGKLDELCRLLEHCIEAKNYDENDFISLCRPQLKWENPLTEQSLVALYKKFQQLEKDGRNSLWSRIIKNAFAPVFRATPLFDYVVGNPPWVRWGYLSGEYREATKKLWVDYGLFSLKGMAARLGGGEKDFSMLFVYACADYYLREGGRLGFVITQEVFKAKGAGEGFRRFRLREDGAYLKVLKAGDLVTVKPFENAANKTATIILEKGMETSYPVPYTVWQRKKGVGNIDTATPLGDVLTLTTREELGASPVENKTSAWQTISKGEGNALIKVKGESAYKAFRGASTEPYGVFWLKLKNVRSDGMLVMENLPELGKRDIQKVDNINLESDLVYPAVRGRDIKRWQASLETYVLIVQDPNTRKGYPESRMKNEWPETYKYLQQFEAPLRTRAAFIKYYEPSDPFYSQFNISSYTFKPHKVVWKRMANDLVATVMSTFSTPFGNKIGIGTDTTSLIPFEDADEAHYVCALINSSLIGAFIRSFSSAGRGFGAPSIINHISLPPYAQSNLVHETLSTLSKQAHQLAIQGKAHEKELLQVEQEIDRQASKLWGLTDSELSQFSSFRKIG